MNTPFPALIAFDFDGTMADTEELTLPDFWDLLRTHYNIPITRELWMDKFHGKAGPSLMKELNAHFGSNLEWEEFLPRRNARLPALFAQGISLAPGLEGVLEALHNQGTPFCICTNSQGARNAMALKSLRIQNETIRTYLQNRCLSGVEDGRNAKPAPDVYNDALAQFNATPGASVAVEDTVAGLQAAVAAGYIALGYTGLSRAPAKDTEALTNAGATAVFDDWSAFLPLLATLNQNT